MKRFGIVILVLILFAACTTVPPSPTVTPNSAPTLTPTITLTSSPALTPTLPAASTPIPLVPNFDHIVIIVLENKESGTVLGNADMPNFNKLANDHTLLTQFYAITHPSLPNYLALIGGDTFGVTTDCHSCFVSAPSLPDLIEASGRTWKTYQEDMPEPCFLGDKGNYAQKHNPFVYFDAIRLNASRCNQSVVPFTALQTDINAGTLPNFIFITPNECNDAHSCPVSVADQWLGTTMAQLVPALDKQGPNYLIVLTWDEGQGNHSCCGLPSNAGGRIAVVLVSPLAKNNFQDATPYTHYSLLKTISNAWGLPYLGHAAEDNNALILAPWQN